MNKLNNKWIGVIVGVLVVFVIVSVIFPSREGPDVIFVDADKQFITFDGAGTQSFKVNIENREDAPIENIKITTQLHNPDLDFIEILNPEISIGMLDPKARSGEKSINFLVYKTTGDGIKFSGNSTIVVDGLKPSVKEFQITITPSK